MIFSTTYFYYRNKKGGKIMEKCIVTVPKGAEYLIGGKKRLKEGEPLPLPQKGDIFKT